MYAPYHRSKRLETRLRESTGVNKKNTQSLNKASEVGVFTASAKDVCHNLGALSLRAPKSLSHCNCAVARWRDEHFAHVPGSLASNPEHVHLELPDKVKFWIQTSFWTRNRQTLPCSYMQLACPVDRCTLSKALGD